MSVSVVIPKDEAAKRRAKNNNHPKISALNKKDASWIFFGLKSSAFSRGLLPLQNNPVVSQRCAITPKLFAQLTNRSRRAGRRRLTAEVQMKAVDCDSQILCAFQTSERASRKLRRLPSAADVLTCHSQIAAHSPSLAALIFINSNWQFQ